MPFEPGQVVAMREVWQGKLWAERPMVVVRDDDELIATWLPRGTTWLRPTTPDGKRLRIPLAPWKFAGSRWSARDVLQLTPPGAGHSVWVRWDGEGRFTGWYVNLQEPLRRTPDGFDYMDLALDIVVQPDLSYEWKDEEDLAAFVRHGLLTAEQAAGVRAEGERMAARIEANEPPFSEPWPDWRPDPSWPIPRLGGSGKPPDVSGRAASGTLDAP